MKLVTTALLLILAAAAPLRAQQSGLAFLRIGTNAAALAMADAHVAHSRDAFSTYWNPAGLAGAQGNSAALSFHRWVASQRTYALSTRFQAGARGGIGVFVTATSSGDLEARQLPGEPDGLFRAEFVNTGLAYGLNLGPVRAGITAKFLSERIFSEDATGYAFDFGAQADALAGSVQFGAALQNVGKMNRLSAVATPLPRLLRAGVAVFPFRILMESDGSALLNTMVTAAVTHNSTDERTQFQIGAEAEVIETILVRAGFITNDTLRRFSAGAGIRFTGITFDYALLPFENGFDGPGHIVSLTYGW
jgi:hypothetical protein